MKSILAIAAISFAFLFSPVTANAQAVSFPPDINMGGGGLGIGGGDGTGINEIYGGTPKAPNCAQWKSRSLVALLLRMTRLTIDLAQ